MSDYVREAISAKVRKDRRRLRELEKKRPSRASARGLTRIFSHPWKEKILKTGEIFRGNLDPTVGDEIPRYPAGPLSHHYFRL